MFSTQSMFSLPPFYKNDPELWFIQVEHLFSTTGIVNSVEKYCLFVANAHPDVIALVSQVVKNYAINPMYRNAITLAYDDVKVTIINKFKTMGLFEFSKLFKDEQSGQLKRIVTIEKPTNDMKLPPFSSENPEAWFLQVDAAFVLANITSEKEKFSNFMVNMDPQVLPFIKDTQNMPSMSYTEVKKKILSELKTHKVITNEKNETTSNVQEKLLKLEDFIEKNFVKFNKLIDDNCTTTAALQKRLEILEKNENSAATIVNSVQRIIALEDKTVFVEKYVAESTKKFEYLRALCRRHEEILREVDKKHLNSTSNSSVKEFSAIEKKLNDTVSQETFDKYIADNKKKIDKLLALNVSLDKYISELTLKMNNSNINKSAIEDIEKQMVLLDTKVNNSIKKDAVIKALLDMKQQITKLDNVNFFINRRIDELEGKFHEMMI